MFLQHILHYLYFIISIIEQEVLFLWFLYICIVLNAKHNHFELNFKAIYAYTNFIIEIIYMQVNNKNENTERLNVNSFTRVELLLGKDALERIASKKVILFGVGGVGSWCAEALVRSGVTHLTMVDPDWVNSSNINRQLPATQSTIGELKVAVLKNRLLEINPNAKIEALAQIYTEIGRAHV